MTTNESNPVIAKPQSFSNKHLILAHAYLTKDSGESAYTAHVFVDGELFIRSVEGEAIAEKLIKLLNINNWDSYSVSDKEFAEFMASKRGDAKAKEFKAMNESEGYFKRNWAQFYHGYTDEELLEFVAQKYEY